MIAKRLILEPLLVVVLMSSVKIRVEQLRTAWALIKQRPLFGWGLNSFVIKRQDISNEKGEHVHCEPVEVMVELGVVGLALWLLIIAGIVLHGLSNPMMPMLIAMLVICLFYFPLRRPHTGLMFWIILGLLAR